MAVGTRTPRIRALEIGTQADGFNGVDYDAQAGVPKNHPASKHYKEQPEAVGSPKPSPNQGKPFKVG